MARRGWTGLHPTWPLFVLFGLSSASLSVNTFTYPTADRTTADRIAAVAQVDRQQTPVGSQDQPPPAPSFRSASSDLVVLPITVTDKRGELVADLPQDRFSVYDNGRRQPIALFSNEDSPVSVALVIDNSSSMRPKLGEVVAAALAFARSSNPHDELTVVEFNDSVQDALGGRKVAAADVAELREALERLVPEGRTALYNAVLDGLDHLEESRLARKVVILVSDGGDNASAATFEHVLARARRSNVTIYTIGLFDNNDPDVNDAVLRRLAVATGGERYLPKSPGPLIAACQRIAREIRSGYTVGFEPPDRDGMFHRVKVEVAPGQEQRRLLVRTRPGYFAGAGSER
jgi:Ca-activated chloride channel family protein